MRYLVAAMSVLAAFFLEWAVGQKISLWFVPPPFTVWVLLCLLWNMKLSSRLWTGVAVGILLDSVSLYPAGTYPVVFTALGAGIEFFRFVFSNVESALTRSISVGAFLFLFLVATPVFGHSIDFLSAYSRGVTSWDVSFRLVGAALLWAVVFAFLSSLIAARRIQRDPRKLW